MGKKKSIYLLCRTSYINFIQKDAGDLINRFSQDIALIDSALGRSFVNVTNRKRIYQTRP